MRKLNYFETRPKLVSLDVEAYLQRIGISKKYHPDLPYLRALHRAHLYSIPFENLDIHHRKKIVLDVKQMYQKVVQNGRGGFCYELNCLFYHLLTQLGFSCRLISCRVVRENGALGPEFDHMAIVVKLKDEEWLADVGFGDGFLGPKKIMPGEVQVDFTRYFKFEEDVDRNFTLMMSEFNDTYIPKYSFTLANREMIEFLDMLDFHQTSPKSPFTQKKLITQASKEGRTTLTDSKIRIAKLGNVSEEKLLNEDEFYSKLEQHFSISKSQLVSH